MKDLILTMRPATRSDLEVLNKHLHLWGPKDYHSQRIARQESGETLWLIAWNNEVPVGHLEIIWKGSKEKEVYEKIENCPNLDAIGVKEELRSQGIGTVLIKAAEDIIKKKGYEQVGMGVSVDNIRAKELYERMGYKDWGKGSYQIIWEQFGDKGERKMITEQCIYLIKHLD